MFDNSKWNKASQLVAIHLEPFLKYFHIEFNRTGNRYSFKCPLHDGDNANSGLLYNNKNHIYYKCLTNCPEQKKDGITFIKNLLSRTIETTYNDTINFIYSFTNNEIPKTAQAPRENENDFFKRAFSEEDRPSGRLVTREIVRSRLQIPAQYYIKRGFSLKVLDEYDVGYCNNKEQKFYNRAVIPCYDLKGQYYEGCTSRSIYEECPKCSYFHCPTKQCPITKYDYFVASKWLHDGIKSSYMLYNSWKAIPFIQKTHKAILVEGVMDCIRLSSIGIYNTVAIYGNSLKEGQAELLDRCGVMDLIVMLDNDEAGLKGAIDIKKKYSRQYRIYYPKYKGKDVGELQTDIETDDIKKILLEMDINE